MILIIFIFFHFKYVSWFSDNFILIWPNQKLNSKNFSNENHQVHKTCSNCLELKQCNTNFHHAKSDKHECGKIVATWFEIHWKLLCCIRYYLFSPHEKSYFFVSTWNNSCEFCAFDGVYLQAISYFINNRTWWRTYYYLGSIVTNKNKNK